MVVGVVEVVVEEGKEGVAAQEQNMAGKTPGREISQCKGRAEDPVAGGEGKSGGVAQSGERSQKIK